MVFSPLYHFAAPYKFSQFLHGLRQSQSWQCGRYILPKFWRSQIIFLDHLSSNRMRVMEWNDSCIWPQHQLFHNLIRAQRALGKDLRIKRNEFPNLLVAPSSAEVGMPKWEVLQLPDLPHPVLFDILILVDTAFPPLDEAAGVGILDALVGSSTHQCTETPFGMVSIWCDVDNVLHLGVVEEEAVDGTVASLYEMTCESSNIESLHSLLFPVTASDELNEGIWIVRIEIDDLCSN
jgi:hypothetical protein